MSVIEQCVHRDPADPRLLRLDDGRPVLAVIGGGHDEPFTRLQLQLIAERVERAWNGAAEERQARAALQHERDCLEAAKAEIARLQARLGEAVDQARTLEESYDTAVARLALAKDHMHPDQRVAFNDQVKRPGAAQP